MATVPHATPEPQPIALRDLPPVRSTANGRRPVAPDEGNDPRRELDLVAFDEQYTVPPEDLEVEDVDGATAVPEVGGPGRQAYFRADPARTWTGRLLRVEDTGDYYLLAQSVEHPDAAVYRLHLLITRKGTLRLWPVRMPVNGDDFPSARQQRAILADAAAVVGVLPMERWEARVAGSGDGFRISPTSRAGRRSPCSGSCNAPSTAPRSRTRRIRAYSPSPGSSTREPGVQVWAVDFEFGDGPAPRCLVARDLARTRLIHVWEDELRTLTAAPFPVGADSIMTAYLASAEIRASSRWGGRCRSTSWTCTRSFACS